MTPKDKAKELCEHYSMLLFYRTNLLDKKMVLELKFLIKQSALITVNEILKINWYHSEPTCFDDLLNEHKEKSVYWDEVKQELEKL